MGQRAIGFGIKQIIGFTAQEVQEIVDKAIKNNFDNYMGVSGGLSLLLSEVVKLECAKTIEEALKAGKNEFSQELSALKESINFDNIKQKLAATKRDSIQLNYEIDKLYGEYCKSSAELLSKCNSICDMLNSISSSCDVVTMGQETIKELVLRYEQRLKNANEQIIQTIKQQENVLFDKISEEGERIIEQQAKQYAEAIGRLDAQGIEIHRIRDAQDIVIQKILEMLLKTEGPIPKSEREDLDKNIDNSLNELADNSKNIRKRFNIAYEIKALYNDFCSMLNKSISVLRQQDNSITNLCEVNFKAKAEEIIACCANNGLTDIQLEQVKNTLKDSGAYVKKCIIDNKNFYLTQKMVGQYTRLLGILLGVTED